MKFDFSNYYTTFSDKKDFKRVSKSQPCIHCGKTDWCYVLGDTLSVCKRSDFPTSGWVKTSKTDREGTPIFALEGSQKSLKNQSMPSYRENQNLKSIKSLAKFPDTPDKVSVIADKDKRTIVYPYGENYDVIRPEELVDGHWQKISKQMRPRHRKGREMIVGKGDKPWEWQAYRIDEALQQCKNKWVLIVEGEKCVEIARQHQLVAITWQGGSWGSEDIGITLNQLKKAKAEGVIFFPDNDKAGQKKADTFFNVAIKAEIPFQVINPCDVWSEMPEKGDIADWLEAVPDANVEKEIIRAAQTVKAQTTPFQTQISHPEPNLITANSTSQVITSSTTRLLDLLLSYGVVAENIKNSVNAGGTLDVSHTQEIIATIVKNKDEDEVQFLLEEIRQYLQIAAYRWDKMIAPTIRRAKRERYREELRHILAIDDPLDQSDEIHEISLIYRVSERKIKQDLTLLENRTYTAKKKGIRQALEYDKIDSEPIPYLIPGLLPQGQSILLSGLSGTGKTIFALDLAESLLEGEEVYGFKPSKRAKVLLLITDQPRPATMSYLRNKGIDLTNPNLDLWLPSPEDEDKGFTVNDLLTLRKGIEDFRPDFIVADSLRAIVSHPTGVSENDMMIGSYVSKVVQECTRFGATLLMIHHDNKSTDQTGIAKASGSGDIPARFDIHWQIEAPMGNNYPKRNLKTGKTRSVMVDGSFNFDPDEFLFQLEHWNFESAEVPKSLCNTMNRINHILKLNVKGLAIWQIEDILKKGAEVTTRTIRRCLAQMTERFMIGRKKHPNHQRAFLYFLKPVEPDQACCTAEPQQTPEVKPQQTPEPVEPQQTPEPVEPQQTPEPVEFSEEQINALSNADLPEIPPDKIQVGDRVIVLAGYTDDQEGTVEKIDFHRSKLHVHCTVRLDNNCTTDEPLFNLRWTKDRQR